MVHNNQKQLLEEFFDSQFKNNRYIKNSSLMRTFDSFVSGISIEKEAKGITMYKKHKWLSGLRYFGAFNQPPNLDLKYVLNLCQN